MRGAGILGTALLVAVTSVTAWGPVAPAADAAAGTGLLVLHDWGMLLSPNGDGVHDSGQITFDLAHPARVDVAVVVDGLRIARADLGRLAPGRHAWRWDGRRDDGTRAADGTYTVVVLSSSGDASDRDLGGATVDTVNSGRVAYARRTVYPRATVVHDAVQLTFVESEWSAYDAEFGEITQRRSVLRVLDRHGHQVHRDVVRRLATPTFLWDGRRDDGKPAEAGTYEGRIDTVDDAGNRWQQSVALHVSDTQLREKVLSWTYPAADALSYEPYYGGCNGCGDVCAPVSSDRFAGGLSFRPCRNSYYYGARVADVASSPEPPAPVDTYRVTATGGPTTPGSADVGRLYAGGKSTTTTPVGDGSATSPWVPVRLADYPFLPQAWSPVSWTFSTDDPNSYDVASFTVDYRYYVPVT
jgi:flagellar hook assembly protein FlgD